MTVLYNILSYNNHQNQEINTDTESLTNLETSFRTCHLYRNVLYNRRKPWIPYSFQLSYLSTFFHLEEFLGLSLSFKTLTIFKRHDQFWVVWVCQIFLHNYFQVIYFWLDYHRNVLHSSQCSLSICLVLLTLITGLRDPSIF